MQLTELFLNMNSYRTFFYLYMLVILPVLEIFFKEILGKTLNINLTLSKVNIINNY